MPTAAKKAAARKPPAKKTTAPTPVEGEFRFISASDILPNPLNPRTPPTPAQRIELQTLAEDIDANGILEPLIVYPEPRSGSGAHIVLAGHRRLAAIDMLDDRDEAAGDTGPARMVPCIVRAAPASDAEALAIMFRENHHRADLTVLEEGQLFEAMALDGLDDDTIARMTTAGPGQVQSRRKLTRLAEKPRTLLQTGQMTLEQAAVFADYAGDQDATDALLKALAGGSAAWRYEVERQARFIRERAKHRAELDELEAAGVRIVVTSDMPEDWRPTAFPDRYALDQARNLPADRESHEVTGCPGLVALNVPGRWPRLFCLHPENHPGTPDDRPEDGDEDGDEEYPDAPTSGIGQPDSEEDLAEIERQHAEAEAERARQAADREACEIAGTLRAKYIQELLTGGRDAITPDMLNAMVQHLIRIALSTYLEPDVAGLAELLNLDPDDEVEDWDDSLVIGEEFARRTPGQNLLALLAQEGESALSHEPAFWLPRKLNDQLAPQHLWWLDLLGGPLGYEWCEWEEQRLDDAAKARNEAAAADLGGDGSFPEQDERPVEDVETSVL